MKLAIHKKQGSFSDEWIDYCSQNDIDYKVVNCESNEILKELADCQILLWHFIQCDPEEIIFAKQLIFALEQSGMVVFPNFSTCWHFDDKLGQKYLFESLNLPYVPTYAFYNKETALEWIKKTEYPVVFKLRGGASSQNVRLIANLRQANIIVKKAFNKGFKQYDAIGNLKERFRLYKIGRGNLYNVLKGVFRIFYEPTFSKIIGRQKGYVYFQDFIPNANYDIRVIIIDNKAFAIKRMVREKDFRASGSGYIRYAKEEIGEKIIELAFIINKKIQSQCLAIDFIFDNKEPKVVEISYSFAQEAYKKCLGYWDIKLNWHEGKFNPYGWMIDSVIKSASEKYKNE